MEKDISKPYFISGELISKYQLHQLLKNSDNLEIWLARQFGDNQPPVVIKFFKNNYPRINHVEWMANFILQNPCDFLINILEFGELSSSIKFEVAEYYTNGTLAQYLKAHKVLSLAQVVYLFKELLKALNFLHLQGIVHRDIKPSNIFINSSGEVKLGDFGIAKIPVVKEEKGQIFGTSSYMSKEQAIDSTIVDQRSDFFSLALVVFEALVGKKFYNGGKFTEVLKYIIADKSAPPTEILTKYGSQKFANLLAPLFEHDYRFRPANAKEILDNLAKIELPEEFLIFEFAKKHLKP